MIGALGNKNKHSGIEIKFNTARREKVQKQMNVKIIFNMYFGIFQLQTGQNIFHE